MNLLEVISSMLSAAVVVIFVFGFDWMIWRSLKERTDEEEGLHRA